MKKDLLSIREQTNKEIADIFALAKNLKRSPGQYSKVLSGKTLALIFEKPSNRTYVSFQVGMYQLGGNSIYLGPEHIKLGVRETVHDVAKTLSRYVNGIVLRTFGHDKVRDMARYASVPVINGLSDLSHPCQALADTFTMQEKLGKLKGLTLAYIGDGNNVCHSLLYCCAKLGINMNVATPAGYEPWKEVVSGAKESAKTSKAKLSFFHRPQDAARDANVLYTDVWASMGQEQEAEARKKVFKDFQIDSRLIALAKKNVLVMHCLPAHRGEEISDDAIDGKHSVVFDQAENRMHVQKAILVKLLS